MDIKKGQAFVLTRGAFDEYDIITVCVANEDINISEAKKEYFTDHPEEKEKSEFDNHKFVKWLLCEKKKAREIEFVEWHVSSYGEIDFIVEERIKSCKKEKESAK